MVRKWCFVRECSNTSVKTPTKIFVTVPREIRARTRWFAAAKRNIKEVSSSTTFYCCQDHFIIEEDMENYVEYRLSKVKVRMRKDVVPHVFKFQPTKIVKQEDSSSLQAAKKRISKLWTSSATESLDNSDYASSTIKCNFDSETTLLKDFKSESAQISPGICPSTDMAAAPMKFDALLLAPLNESIKTEIVQPETDDIDIDDQGGEMPGTRCAVYGCNTTYATRDAAGKKMWFHKFPNPKDTRAAALRKEWVERCNRKDKFNSYTCRVCCLHFTKDDYERDLQNELLGLPLRRILKKDAVPKTDLIGKLEKHEVGELPRKGGRKRKIKRSDSPPSRSKEPALSALVKIERFVSEESLESLHTEVEVKEEADALNLAIVKIESLLPEESLTLEENPDESLHTEVKAEVDTQTWPGEEIEEITFKVEPYL